ncbi:MAG: hypothetical protein ACXVJD_01620 [Mucilaginibacter sp.]
MKILLLLFIMNSILFVAYGQDKHTDSLIAKLNTLPDNEQRIPLLKQLAALHKNQTIAIKYASEGLAMAKKAGRPKDEEDFYFDLGVAYYNAYNYPKSIEMAFAGLALSRQIKDTNYSSTFLYGMSVCYAEAGDYHNAITYSLMDLDLLTRYNLHAKIGNKPTVAALYNNIAGYYIMQNSLDSALNYMQKSYQLAIKIHYNKIGSPTMGLGMIEDRLQHPALAMSYYQLAISYFKKNADPGGLSDADLVVANLYNKTARPDSALYYANESYQLAKQNHASDGLYKSATLLASLLENRDELQSLRYFKIAAVTKDSLNIAEKEKQFQIVTNREQLLQQKLAEQKLKEEKERKENLQLIAIAFFIPLFLLIVLLLSRTRIHRGFIDFMGVLSLLLLFEFITLLIHPWIEKITHHTPVLELLILVALAAVLVPLHHKLTHELKERIVKKPMQTELVKVAGDSVTGPA